MKQKHSDNAERLLMVKKKEKLVDPESFPAAKSVPEAITSFFSSLLPESTSMALIVLLLFGLIFFTRDRDYRAHITW